MVTWLGPWMGHAGLIRGRYAIDTSEVVAAISTWLREMYSCLKGLPPLGPASHATLAGKGLTTVCEG